VELLLLFHSKIAEFIPTFIQSVKWAEQKYKESSKQNRLKWSRDGGKKVNQLIEWCLLTKEGRGKRETDGLVFSSLSSSFSFLLLVAVLPSLWICVHIFDGQRSQTLFPSTHLILSFLRYQWLSSLCWRIWMGSKALLPAAVQIQLLNSFFFPVFSFRFL